MSFSSRYDRAKQQVWEKGGQPLSIGTVNDGQLVSRNGSELAGVTGVRIVGGQLQIQNTDTSLWHTLYVTGAIGFEQLTIGAGTA